VTRETVEKFGGSDEPSTPLELPDRCLSLTVRGPWAHFRRIEGNVVKQTYRVMPRTTVAGLLAAVLGLDRNSYYGAFGPESSAVAIEPVGGVRTVNMPMNTLTTSDDAMQSLNPHGKVSVKLPDPSKPRQQHNYEVLVDPAYRLDVWLDDDDLFATLRDALEAGKSHYVPSLGLSEHLAELDYHGTFEVQARQPDEEVAVDSAIPDAVDDVVLNADTRCQVEQSPAFMARDTGGRTTTAFTSYAYNPDGGSLRVRNFDAGAVVDGRTVAFV
jgi:CRISPR-associated protein Cas5h